MLTDWMEPLEAAAGGVETIGFGGPGAALPPGGNLVAGLLDLQQALGATVRDSAELMERAAYRAMNLLGGTGSAVLLVQGDCLVYRACSGTAVPCCGGWLERGAGLVGRACDTGLPVLSADAEQDPRADADLARVLGGRSVLVAPLLDDTRTLGALEVLHAQPGRFSPADQALLDLIARTLSVALARCRVEEANRRLTQERSATLATLGSTEERFRSALAAARLGVWDWDVASGQITWVGCHEEIFGLAPGSFDGSYHSFVACIHPDDRVATERAITEALTSGNEYSHQHRVVWPDRSVHWVLARGRFYFDAAGNAIRMVGAFMDVTERRALEHQLLQAQKIEAMGQLAAGIAHEINTPTQYVSDNLRFLRDGFDHLWTVVTTLRGLARAPEAAATAARAWTEADGDYLRQEIPRAAAQALEGVERVARIVRAMKEFSHPGGDEPVPADLNRAIENTVAVSRNEWKYVAEVQLELQPDLPPVSCRPGEIQQVLLNLVVNAAHAIADRVATEGGTGRITISTRSEAEIVEVRVSDTGTGIPEAVRARIFEPFFTTKEVGRGTGQGLALAHDVVVKKHRGSLTFTSEVGQGSCFLMRLPMHPADSLGAG